MWRVSFGNFPDPTMHFLRVIVAAVVTALRQRDTKHARCMGLANEPGAGPGAGDGGEARCRRAVKGRILAAAGVGLLWAGCATGPQERRLEARGALDLRDAVRSEVMVARDAWGFTVDPVRKIEPAFGGGFSGAEPGIVLLGMPGYLAIQLVGLANGAVMAAAMDVAQGGYEDGERRVMLAAEGKPLDTAVADAVFAQLQPVLSGRVTRSADRMIPRPVPGRGDETDPARMPTAAAEGRAIRVQVRTLFQGLQRRNPVGVADGSNLLEASPPLALVIAVQVLATTEIESGGKRQEAFVGGVTAHYESPSRLMGSWSADRAKLLRAELAGAQVELLAQIRARIVAPGRAK